MVASPGAWMNYLSLFQILKHGNQMECRIRRKPVIPCPGEVITYEEMCLYEGHRFSSEMNYRSSYDHGVLLMSLTPEASHCHRIESNGNTIIYEGHNAAQSQYKPIIRFMDQPMHFHAGGLTQNGLFFKAALDFRNGTSSPELVRVYEEIKSGIWIYDGLFKVVDGWQEPNPDRSVFRFRLELCSEPDPVNMRYSENWRVLPQSLKLEVWKRNEGRCSRCGSALHLRFTITQRPGSSVTPSLEDITLLCRRERSQLT